MGRHRGRALPALIATLAAAASQAAHPVARPDHPILGTWQLAIPGTGCLETYEYRADGTVHSVSAAEQIDSDFQIGAQPNEAGLYVLEETITSSNGKPDCSGRITPTDKPLTLYLAPLRGGFLLCFDAALRRCLGPMLRLTPAPGGSGHQALQATTGLGETV